MKPRMADRQPAEAPLSLALSERGGLTALSAASFLVFVWAALTLPPRITHPFALGFLALSVLHLLTAASAVLRPRWLALVWPALAWASLGGALVCTGAVIGTSRAVVGSHGALGWALAALLGAILALVLVMTLPVALWGLRRARGKHAKG